MESIYPILKTTHYTLMLFILVFLIFTIGKFYFQKNAEKEFGFMEDKTTLIVTLLAHLQFVLGLILLFTSPLGEAFSDMGSVMKDSYLRLMLIEHPTTMLLGVIMVTIGRVKSKKKETDAGKYKTVITFFAIALVLFLIRIPWNHLNG